MALSLSACPSSADDCKKSLQKDSQTIEQFIEENGVYPWASYDINGKTVKNRKEWEKASNEYWGQRRKPTVGIRLKRSDDPNLFMHTQLP